MNLELHARNFARLIALPELALEPGNLSWAAMGGCDRAEIHAAGGELALWELANLLCCPVTVRHDNGDPAWWGYVAEVQIQVGRWQMSVSLDSMANRVAVAYEEVIEGQSGAGTRATTDWADDADSQAEYGIFERLEPLTYATLATAEDYRDRCLLDWRFPVPSLTYSDSSAMEATLTCLGWWHSLKYRYYSNASGALMATTDLAYDIIDTAGQWFAGQNWLDDLEDNDVAQYRDGDTNALAQVEELLSQGSGASPRRVLPNVTIERIVQMQRERSSVGATELVVDSEARFTTVYGAPVQLGPEIVGVWCRVNDVIPAAASMVALADPSRLWIERAEYDCRTGALHTEGRGMSAWELGGFDIR
jgi:hypothetical protein